MDKNQGLTPPANLEAEQAVLGAVLLRAETFDEVSTVLRQEDFYRTAHGHIFRAMLDLYLKGEPIELVSVTALLKERGKLDEVGGSVFLADLSEHVGTAANAPYYAHLVRQKSRLRQLLAATQNIAAGCLGQIEDVDAFIDEAEGCIFQIREEKQAQAVFTLEEMVPEEIPG